MVEDGVWKRRFLIFTLVRLSGLALFLLGVGIALGDIVRPGGFPLLGGIVAIAGLIDVVVVSRLLKSAWERR